MAERVGFELESDGVPRELETSLRPEADRSEGFWSGRQDLFRFPTSGGTAASWEMTKTVEPTRRERM